MAVTLTGDWFVARRILATASSRTRRAIEQAVLAEAHLLRAKIVEGLREQAPGGDAFRPLAQSTLAMRRFRRFGGTKALIVRGDLRNSIVVRREGEGAFVGVLRTARGRGGAPLANVAELNEFGSRPIVIRVTPRMRRLLAAVFREREGRGGGGGDRSSGGSAPGIIVVQIPARPFIRPVVDRYFGDQGEVRERFLGRIATSLGGDFGGPGSSSEGAAIMRSRRITGERSGGAGGLATGWVSRVLGGGPRRDPRTGRFT